MTRFAIAALAICAASGCFRSTRPELGGERTVETGIPVVLGAEGGPEVDWEFGDGQSGHGAQVRHAFAQAGRYRVRALEGKTELASVFLEVVVRPVLHAIPEDAEGAFYLPRVGGRLEGVIDFAERLVGPDTVQRYVEASVLAPLALEDPNVEANGGIGLFTVRDFRGLVGLLAAKDPQKLLAAVAQRFTRMGAGLFSAPDGSVRINGPDGVQLAAVAERGYVYLIVPQAEAGAPGDTNPDRAVAAIRRASNGGLGESGRWESGDTPPAAIGLFLEILSKREGKSRTLVASAALNANVLTLEGALLCSGPLWDVERAPRSGLLGSAPEGFVGVVSASVSPQELSPVLLGLLEEPSREAALARWGFSRADLERVLGALAGDAALLAYFDPDAYYGHLVQSGSRPEARGTVVVAAGESRPGTVEEVVRSRLDQTGQRVAAPSGVSRWVVEGDQRAELTSNAGTVTFTLGQPLRGARVDLTRLLQARFGAGTFSQGHLSAALDLGALLKGLEAPVSLKGVAQERLDLLQGISATFVRQVTSVDVAFLDVTPTPRGAHLKGSLSLRR